MKYLLAIVMVMISTVCWSAPFLVCSPVENADTIQVTIDGATQTVTGNSIRIDLASLAAGNHTATAKACNVWGCSADTAPFVFTKTTPGMPILSIASE